MRDTGQELITKQAGALETAIAEFDERIATFASLANRLEALADQLFGSDGGKDKVATEQAEGMMGALLFQTQRLEDQVERINDALGRLEGLV